MTSESYFINSCRYGRLHSIKLMMKIRRQDVVEGLRVACMYGHLDIVKYFIGINEYKNSELNEALEYTCSAKDNIDVFKYLVEECKVNITNIDKIYCNACLYGCYNIVRYLLERKVDHGIRAITNGLMSACRHNHINVIKYLVELGVKSHRITSWSQNKELLNMGLDKKLLGNRANNIIIERDARNVVIGNELLDKTELCINVIDLVCSYTEY